MVLATYLCRIGGVVLMSRVRITPRVERGLRALPGSIIVATILPLVLDGGHARHRQRRGRARHHDASRDPNSPGSLAGLGTRHLLRALGL